MTFEIDWSAQRPDQASFDADWLRAEIVKLENRPALIEIEQALADMCINRGARVAQFRFGHVDSAVRWAMSRNRFDEFKFFARFFAHPVVLAAVPEAARPTGLDEAFGMEATFTSFGRVADSLTHGGAYRRSTGTDEHAWNLTRRFIADTVDFRIRDSFAWVS